MSTLEIGLSAVASLLGIYYAALGISAVKYLRNADEIDKTVGWTLWWCVNVGRYEDEGRRLCKKGQIAAGMSVVLWVAIYTIQ